MVVALEAMVLQRAKPAPRCSVATRVGMMSAAVAARSEASIVQRIDRFRVFFLTASRVSDRVVGASMYGVFPVVPGLLLL